MPNLKVFYHGLRGKTEPGQFKQVDITDYRDVNPLREWMNEEQKIFIFILSNKAYIHEFNTFFISMALLTETALFSKYWIQRNMKNLPAPPKYSLNKNFSRK